ncbi:MAG: endonuclease [Firmicutes bacterium]|nr:endonuclease [Bacillota bacterium]
MVKQILKIIGLIVGIVVVAVGILLGWLTAGEYRPADIEELSVSQAASDPGAGELSPGDSFKIMSWNIGYGALGDNADFFMDGGDSVMTADEERVSSNLDGIISHIKSEDPNIVFLQEADRDSKRSHHVDEVSTIASAFENQYASTFANNFKVPFVPYPLPPIGKVDSGLLTLSEYEISQSARISLPCPFSWPIRTANLKRCLMADRIPVSGGKELVVINLHLEAYDNGEGKIAQTNALLDVLNEERSKGNYVIAGGDFNQTFDNIDSGAYPVLEGMWQPGSISANDFGEGWSLLMDASVPTCRSLDRPLAGLDDSARDPSVFQYYMIDGFIVSDNLEVSGLKTQGLGFENTDHNPVVMKVKIGTSENSN